MMAKLLNNSEFREYEKLFLAIGKHFEIYEKKLSLDQLRRIYGILSEGRQL